MEEFNLVKYIREQKLTDIEEVKKLKNTAIQEQKYEVAAVYREVEKYLASEEYKKFNKI